MRVHAATRWFPERFANQCPLHRDLVMYSYPTQVYSQDIVDRLKYHSIQNNTDIGRAVTPFDLEPWY